MPTITFKFEQKEKQPITVDISKGEMILDVALDNDVNLHHNCGAVCACSTCHIYIEQGQESLTEITDKEEDFVDRARNPKHNSRLACQCILTDDEDIIVTIPDQSVIIGH
ncbi:MAG: 2Fe-2S iron-sulfur cluster binding domain-containing protein [Bacteroidetes bacterium]|nr:2Fe-2S iron-sulfur cluster binding domain-containing protein [Bacteroidota bacterium]